MEPIPSEPEQLTEKVTEKRDDSEKEEDDAKIKDEQLKAEKEEIWKRLNQDLVKHKEMLQEEQRLFSIAKAKYGDGIIRDSESRRIWEIRRPRRRLADKILEEAVKYLCITGEREALESEDGWMSQLLEEHGLKICQKYQ